MGEAKQPFWEESYKREGKPDTFLGGRPAPDVVFVASKLERGAKILDLGSGEGRNSLYLAQEGFDITAIDISEAGIRKLKDIASSLGVEVSASVCDMRDFDFSQDYNLIINHSCLQYMPREQWKILIEKMETATIVGGYNIVDVFTDDVPAPDDQKTISVGLFKTGELPTLYEDWEIIEDRPYVIEHTHPNGPTHKHSGENLIARKLR